MSAKLTNQKNLEFSFFGESTQPAFTCSKSTTETPEEFMKPVQS